MPGIGADWLGGQPSRAPITPLKDAHRPLPFSVAANKRCSLCLSRRCLAAWPHRLLTGGKEQRLCRWCNEPTLHSVAPPFLLFYLCPRPRFDGPEPGDLWGLGPGEEVLVRPPATSMAFSDFVRLLRERGIKETFYLEYLALHQYLGAPLAVRAIVRQCCFLIDVPVWLFFGSDVRARDVVTFRL